MEESPKGTHVLRGGDGSLWGPRRDAPETRKGLFLESSLCREVNERAFLIQILRQKLFNSAELICSHGGECLKVRADFDAPGLVLRIACSPLLG